MKDCANLMHVYKQDFFKSCKSFILHNSANDRNIEFMQACNRGRVMACPIYVKIQNKVLSLKGYKLSHGHAMATAKYLMDSQDRHA